MSPFGVRNIVVMTGRGPVACEFKVWKGKPCLFDAAAQLDARNSGLRSYLWTHKPGAGLSSIKRYPPDRSGRVEFCVVETGSVKIAMVGLESAQDLDVLMEIEAGMHVESIACPSSFMIYPLGSDGYVVPNLSMRAGFESVMSAKTRPMVAGSAAPTLEEALATEREIAEEQALRALIFVPEEEREFTERLRSKLARLPEPNTTIEVSDSYMAKIERVDFLERIKAKVRS